MRLVGQTPISAPVPDQYGGAVPGVAAGVFLSPDAYATAKPRQPQVSQRRLAQRPNRGNPETIRRRIIKTSREALIDQLASTSNQEIIKHLGTPNGLTDKELRAWQWLLMYDDWNKLSSIVSNLKSDTIEGIPAALALLGVVWHLVFEASYRDGRVVEKFLYPQSDELQLYGGEVLGLAVGVALRRSGLARGELEWSLPSIGYQGIDWDEETSTIVSVQKDTKIVFDIYDPDTMTAWEIKLRPNLIKIWSSLDGGAFPRRMIRNFNQFSKYKAWLIENPQGRLNYALVGQIPPGLVENYKNFFGDELASRVTLHFFHEWDIRTPALIINLADTTDDTRQHEILRVPNWALADQYRNQAKEWLLLGPEVAFSSDFVLRICDRLSADFRDMPYLKSLFKTVKKHWQQLQTEPDLNDEIKRHYVTKLVPALVEASANFHADPYYKCLNNLVKVAQRMEFETRPFFTNDEPAWHV